jgi:hypothetical protein
LAVTVLAAQPGPARADNATEQARQHYASGTKQYDMGHWDEAIAEFEKAYDLRPDPSFLYNLAQAHRRKGDLKRALDLYKNFALKLPKGQQRDEVEEKIAAVQKQIDEAATKPAVERSANATEPSAAETQVPSTPTPAPSDTAAPQAAQPSTPAAAPVPTLLPLAPPPEAWPVAVAPATTVREDGKASDPGQGLRVAGIVCGSVGLASVVAGAVFGWEAKVLSDRVTGAKKFNSTDEAAGKRAEILQWVFYGVGAGGIVAGGVLYYMGLTATSASGAKVSVTPIVGPNTTGVAATGAF